MRRLRACRLEAMQAHLNRKVNELAIKFIDSSDRSDEELVNFFVGHLHDMKRDQSKIFHYPESVGLNKHQSNYSMHSNTIQTYIFITIVCIQ